MAFTPNNPYIPGDPYSYDLKWIICQLKKLGSDISGLDERIQAAVMAALDQHDPIYFETAADLISSGIKTEALAYIEGFYAPGDGGANLYYTTSDFNDVIDAPFYLTLEGANRWALPIILTPYITPQMFGAYGDNEHDDTEALNKTFVMAFKYRRSVWIPDGDYKHTGITIYGGSFRGDTFRPSVRGSSRSTTRLHYEGDGVGVAVRPYENISYIQGIELSDMEINSTDSAAAGIDIGSGTRIDLHQISVNHGAVGIRGTSDIWLSTFKDLYIGVCPIGLQLTGGSNTSLSLDQIYVMYSSDTAYKINATYSHIGILAADFCSGNYVYNIDRVEGTIDTLACEGCSAATLFRFNNSHVLVGTLHVINAAWDSVVGVCDVVNGTVNVTALRTYSPTAVTTTAPLARLYTNARFEIINAGGGNVTLAPIKQMQAGLSAVATLAGVSRRPNTGRTYVGTDRALGTAMLPEAFNRGTAIFTDCTEAPRYLADHTDQRWNTPVNPGDWFIENDPATYMRAAYVVYEQSWGDAAALKYGVIPILSSGNTASRPASASPVGLCYFDTTLGKPIFYKGNSVWVDATGATV